MRVIAFGHIARMLNESVVKNSFFEQNDVTIKTESRRRQEQEEHMVP